MTVFSISLEARAPEANHLRAYHVTVAQDLLGDWLIDVAFGRIGRANQQRRYVARDRDAAIRQLKACLQRRVSAPKRIGTAYRCRQLHDPDSWLSQGPIFAQVA